MLHNVGRNHSSLLSLMIIILCDVFATPNLPDDLLVRIQFYPLCHLHENTTSQLHQKILLLIKSKCTVFSSKKPFSANQSCSQQWNCHYAQSYLYILMKSVPFFPVISLSTEKKKKSQFELKTSEQNCLIPILVLIYGTSSQSLCAKERTKNISSNISSKDWQAELGSLRRGFPKISQ